MVPEPRGVRRRFFFFFGVGGFERLGRRKAMWNLRARFGLGALLRPPFPSRVNAGEDGPAVVRLPSSSAAGPETVTKPDLASWVLLASCVSGQKH